MICDTDRLRLTNQFLVKFHEFKDSQEICKKNLQKFNDLSVSKSGSAPKM